MRGMTWSILAAIVLAGCNYNSLDNQIEKCVQAAVTSGVEFQDRLEKTGTPEDKERYGKTKASIETWARVRCLEAASGKSN